MLFLKKWREFSEGGNDIWVFLKKGKHPHRAERQSRADGRKEGRNTREGRAEQEEQTERLKK